MIPHVMGYLCNTYVLVLFTRSLTLSLSLFLRISFGFDVIICMKEKIVWVHAYISKWFDATKTSKIVWLIFALQNKQ